MHCKNTALVLLMSCVVAYRSLLGLVRSQVVGGTGLALPCFVSVRKLANSSLSFHLLRPGCFVVNPMYWPELLSLSCTVALYLAYAECVFFFARGFDP